VHTRGNLLKVCGFSGLLLALFLLPVFVKDPFWLNVFIMLFTYIILGVSLYPTVRMGQLAISHAAFMAMGAYTSALLTMRLGLCFWLALPLAGIMAAVLAIPIGALTLRLKGIFFIIVTTGVNEIVRLIIVSWPSVLGGVNGISDIPVPTPITIPGLATIEFTTRAHYYFLILLLMIGTVVGIHRLDHTALGRIYRANHDSEPLLQSLGVNLMTHKTLIFSTGCFFAGLAGAFFAHYYSILTPDSFGLWASIRYILFIQIGGPTSIAGPIVGVLLFAMVEEIFRFALVYQPLILGVIVILVILFLPEGLISMRLPNFDRAKKFIKGKSKEKY